MQFLIKFLAVRFDCVKFSLKSPGFFLFSLQIQMFSFCPFFPAQDGGTDVIYQGGPSKKYHCCKFVAKKEHPVGNRSKLYDWEKYCSLTWRSSNRSSFKRIHENSFPSHKSWNSYHHKCLIALQSGKIGRGTAVRIQLINQSREDSKLFMAYIMQNKLTSFSGISQSYCPESIRCLAFPFKDENHVSSLMHANIH